MRTATVIVGVSNQERLGLRVLPHGWPRPTVLLRFVHEILMESIVRTGAEGNVWRVARATRAGMLVDADAYFRAVHHALCHARQQILILGWDIDSRLCLRRDLVEEKRKSATLGPLLRRLASAPQGPQCFILTWDFALIYAFERELLTQRRLRHPTSPGLQIMFDDMHPLGASHHQKVVVVDDTVAFCGGLDLCGARWDTPAHRHDDPRRHDPPLPPHAPFHDVQLAVMGPIAAALGDLVRERWFRATGRRIAAATVSARTDEDADEAHGALWPPHISAEFTDVPVAVARTEPTFNGRREVREVERLHLDAIAAATRCVYVENQYFTSHTIAAALARRLHEPTGPDIVIVQPRECSGWLESATMGVLRRRLMEDLRRADRHGRLWLYHPTVACGAQRLNVHSKVTIIDDVLLRVGSANLSNRSMGFDTECDLAIEADRAESSAAIAHVRATLLAEHLGVDVSVVRQATVAHGLAAAVEKLRRAIPTQGLGPRTLAPLDVDAVPWLQALTKASAFIDPDRVAAYDPTAHRELPCDEGSSIPTVSRTVGVISIIATLAVLGWLGCASPLTWVQAPVELSGLPPPLGGAVLGLVTCAMAGFLGVPPVFLHLNAALVFGPVWGALVSVFGAVLAAGSAWCLGGPRTHRRGNRGDRDFGRCVTCVPLHSVKEDKHTAEHHRVTGAGTWTVASRRFLRGGPLWPSLCAFGSYPLTLRTYVVGTLLGLLPGGVAMACLAAAVHATMKRPGPASIGVFVMELLLLAAWVRSLARWGRRRRDSMPEQSASSAELRVSVTRA